MGKPDQTAARRAGNAHAPIFGDGNQLFSDDERAGASYGFKSGGPATLTHQSDRDAPIGCDIGSSGNKGSVSALAATA